MHVQVFNLKYDNMESEAQESSSEIKERVNNARKIQLNRYKNYEIYSDSELNFNLINKFCKLDKNSKLLLKKSFEKMNFSSRAYFRILKVARTIADLDDSANIKEEHILEAVQYRNLDRKE